MADYSREQIYAAMRAAAAAGDAEAVKALAAQLNTPSFTPEEEAGGLTGQVSDEGPQPQPSFMGSVGDIVESAASIPGVVINPVGQALYNVTGHGDQTYDTGTIVREGLGLPRNPDGFVRAANTAGTAALTGSLAGRGIAAALQPGVAQSVAQTVGSAPLTDTLAGMFAGLGSEGARQSGAGPIGQTVAAIAAGGPALGLSALASRAPRIATPFAQAAERQGVDYMAADTGSSTAGRLTGGLGQSFVSSGTIRNAAERTQGQLAGAVDRQARGQAAAATTDVAGEGVRNAATRYSQQTSARGGRLYRRAEQQSQGVQIVPTRAIQAIDTQLTRLRQLGGTNAPIIRQLETLRQDVANGVSVGSLRDLRTSLRDRTAPDGSLRSDAQQFMFGEIVDRVSDDITDGLTNAGRQGAANTFQTADRFWRQRVQHIDQVLAPITGKDGMKGGEQIVQTLEGMARGQSGGNRRLARLIGNMEPDEQAAVRSVVIDRLGRANPGQQTAEGDAFSASTFLTNWSKMTPQAKGTIFNDPGLRANLDDIATIAEGVRNTGRFANASNTGSANVVTGVSYALGAGTAGLQTAAAAAALQYGTARLLASPGFARWLARAPATTNPGAARAYLQRLEVLAGRESLLAPDIHRFMNAANDTVGASAAASETEEQQ